MTPTLTEIIESSLLAERTADVADQASRVEEEEAMHRRIAHDRKMKREQEPNTEGVYEVLDCDEGGLEIGLDRIQVAIANRHCVTCQGLKERRHGYRG